MTAVTPSKEPGHAIYAFILRFIVPVYIARTVKRARVLMVRSGASLKLGDVSKIFDFKCINKYIQMPVLCFMTI